MAWTGPERWGNDDLFSRNTPPSAALILPEVCEWPDNAGESSSLEGSPPGSPRSRWSDQKNGITGRRKPRIWPEPWPGTFKRPKAEKDGKLLQNKNIKAKTDLLIPI